MIERRTLLRALGLGLLGIPGRAAAQPARRTYRIGFLGGASASGYAPFVDAFMLAPDVLGGADQVIPE